MSSQTELAAPERRRAEVQNYRIEDFCAAFGIGKRTAHKLIREGAVEALKVGRRTLITAESAAAWRARCPRVTPASAPTA